jgi:hypothetical protein
MQADFVGIVRIRVYGAPNTQLTSLLHQDAAKHSLTALLLLHSAV